MPTQSDTGSFFSETSNQNERILFTSESVGEGHPGNAPALLSLTQMSSTNECLYLSPPLPSPTLGITSMVMTLTKAVTPSLPHWLHCQSSELQLRTYLARARSCCSVIFPPQRVETAVQSQGLSPSKPLLSFPRSYFWPIMRKSLPCMRLYYSGNATIQLIYVTISIDLINWKQIKLFLWKRRWPECVFMEPASITACTCCEGLQMFPDEKYFVSFSFNKRGY